MRLYVSILFLTLVVTSSISFAAPVIDHRPTPLQISPQQDTQDIIFEPASDRSWSLRLGLLNGALKETLPAEQLYFYGLRYGFLKKPLQKWEIEISTGGTHFLHLVIGKKFYFPLEDVTLPYYKFSIGDLIHSNENLGAVLNIKKIQAIAAVGLDDLFQWDRRLQGELAVSYAWVGPQLEASLGLAF